MGTEIDLDIFRNSQIIEKNIIFEKEFKSYKKIKNNYSNESFEFRNAYYKILKHFTKKYSNDIFSMKILEEYKEKLFRIDEKEIRINLSKVFKNKNFRKFKYMLLCDCLFINSFHNKEKALEIIKEFKKIYKYPQKFIELFNVLYDDTKNIQEFNKLKKYIKFWKINKKFSNQKDKKILIVATMSAGKSTLINALIGKKISKVTNEACTEKLHYIYNKPFEDNRIYEFDNELSLNATEKILLENNEENIGNEILVSSYFRNFKKKICLIDTPGVNFSLRANDKTITEEKIKEKDYDVLLYVFNAENISSNDNFNCLNYILENKKDDNIIFVINKLDNFKKGEDSIDETIINVEKELTKIGFKNPIIRPVSAHAGYLAKQKIFNEIQDEDTLEELEELVRKFKKEYWNLSKYYNYEKTNDKIENDRYEMLLKNSGISLLENKISKM